jgi:hypothetical protein
MQEEVCKIQGQINVLTDFSSSSLSKRRTKIRSDNEKKDMKYMKDMKSGIICFDPLAIRTRSNADRRSKRRKALNCKKDIEDRYERVESKEVEDKTINEVERRQPNRKELNLHHQHKPSISFQYNTNIL